MALPEPSHQPLTLLTLPTEMYATIFTHLWFLDLHNLRLTNRYFHSLIPPLILTELLEIEALVLGFLACVGCTRLRPINKFSSSMYKRKKEPGHGQAHNRFCIDCGRRPLPGIHRYTRGSRWDEQGVFFVRCLRCGKNARAPEDQAVPLCLSCHRQDLERARAAQELERVRREATAQEERRLLRAERRRRWIEAGSALSDSFSEDTDEMGDREYSSDWGQDDGMNHSAHS